MTDDQFYEAKKLIDDGMSTSKAAAQVGVPYTTLYRRLNKDEEPQAPMEPETESEPDIDVHPNIAAIDWSALNIRCQRPETQAQKEQREHDQWAAELKRKRRTQS